MFTKLFSKRNNSASSKNPPQTNTQLNSEIISEIKQLQISTKKIASEQLLGGYKSAFKGRGIEFEDVREYTPGDDVRTIDWKVTARSSTTGTSKAYVKRFREERELSVMIAVDVSESLNSSSSNITREKLAARVAAALTLIAMQNNDKVGLLTFSNKLESFYPPRKSKNALWRVIHEVMKPNVQGLKTDLNALNEFLLRRLKRKSVIFIISDFLDKSALNNLSHLSARHDLNAVVIEDRLDYQLPSSGLAQVINPETKEKMLIDTSSKKTRVYFETKMKEQRKDLESEFKKTSVSSLWLRTDKPFIPPLKKFFIQKSKLSNHRPKILAEDMDKELNNKTGNI